MERSAATWRGRSCSAAAAAAAAAVIVTVSIMVRDVTMKISILWATKKTKGPLTYVPLVLEVDLAPCRLDLPHYSLCPSQSG